jgi:hypothetical protein
VPIIASNAGGIPLQVKEGKNGWIVPTASDVVAKLLVEIHQGKKRVHREISTSQMEDGNKSDPNSVAQRWVGDFDQAASKVHEDEGATSEDFWTVGNASKWMLLFDRLLQLPLDDTKANDEDVDLLKSMSIGKPLEKKGVDGVNVWEMVMGNALLEGEAEIITKSQS